MRFTTNRYHLSPYVTKSESTVIILPSSKIAGHTKSKPHSVSDRRITYGPHIDIQPMSEAEVFVHYENNAPFLSVSKLERVIEISHWGNIAVEETFDVRHAGAVLKGPFSRYDYQRNQDGVSSVRSFKVPPTIGWSSFCHFHYFIFRPFCRQLQRTSITATRLVTFQRQTSVKWTAVSRLNCGLVFLCLEDGKHTIRSDIICQVMRSFSTRVCFLVILSPLVGT